MRSDRIGAARKFHLVLHAAFGFTCSIFKTFYINRMELQKCLKTKVITELVNNSTVKMV